MVLDVVECSLIVERERPESKDIRSLAQPLENVNTQKIRDRDS